MPVITGSIFLLLSVLVYRADVQNGFISFLLGFIASASIVMLMIRVYKDRKQTAFFRFFAKYTMPTFVMHTLFAAPLRVVLLKIGVNNAAVHVVLGIAISFIGPIIAAWIMKKSKWLVFFLYPGNVVKFGNKKR